jgi:phenylpropionate dioxygenase-like ring-hydroxylating dioxygenase large terminal subunit
MGNLFREYWLPAMMSSELPEPDSDPVRVMLLGEPLIGFRDSSGRVGLIEENCPHRGASLFFGRNEDSGLRCIYHGWKFDVDGNCVDMTNEPPGSDFKSRVKAVTYPCVERAGMVWTYMGPREVPPPMPELEGLTRPEDVVDVGCAMRECNWLQGLEGDIDTSHATILHGGADKPENVTPGTPEYYGLIDKAPRYVSIDTDFGCMYGAYRPAGEGHRYWRIAQLMFPCFVNIPGSGRLDTRMWVPMDDTHTMYYIMRRKATDPAWNHENNRYIVYPVIKLEPENSTDWYGRFRLQQRLENDWFVNRQAQRDLVSYSGITGVWTQDDAVTVSMGPILNRAKEHLGVSDTMIIRARQRYMQAAQALAEHKELPPGVDHPEVYQIRSVAAILPEEADWIKDTEELRTVPHEIEPWEDRGPADADRTFTMPWRAWRGRD